MKGWLEDGRAVSPVVGVMLMLVVTVVLAAVVSSFAGGMAGTQKKAPQASFAVEIRSMGSMGTPEFVMKHLGGDPVDTDSVKLVTKWYNESTGKWEIQETTAVPLSDNAVIYYDKWTGRYENVTGGTDDAINVLVDLSDVGTCNITEVRLWLTNESGVVASHTETNPATSFWWNTTVTADDTYDVTVNYTIDSGDTGANWTLSSIPVSTTDGNETRVDLSLTARCTKYADVNTEYDDGNSATTLYHVPYLVVPGDFPADASGKETELWFGNYVIQKGDVIKAQINLYTGTGLWQNQRTPIIANATYLKPGDVVTVELIDLTTNAKIFSKDVVVQ